MRAGVLAALLAALVPARPAAALDAAAGKVDITPDLRTEKVLLAGFGATGRKPLGVHDPLYARLLVLREKGRTIGVVGLDLLGIYREDVEDLRRRAGLDAVFVAATHTHSGPDTLGLWGKRLGSSGADPSYHSRIKTQIADGLKLLAASTRPVSASAGRGELDPRGLCRDSRDPQVIDPDLSVLRLTGRDGKAVATVVNWSCHPEVIGRENRLVTADYPGPLCARVEEKTGGACVFLNGMIGGLMTPDVKRENFYEAYRVGASVADAALALKTSSGPSRPLAYRSVLVRVPVENSRYRLLLSALAFGHKLFAADGRELPPGAARLLSLRHLLFGLEDKDAPWLETEVSVLDIGPVRMLGIPGEAFPELAIGGYDGKYSFGRPVLTPDGPNPPDLSTAPKGPYLRDLVKARAPMLVGLANDELGYLVPGYDFKVRPSKLLLPRYPGHYEETNSIGPTATGLIVDAAAKLLKENP